MNFLEGSSSNSSPVKGIFRPLSNYFALPFDMKGERYRSVEHYAYQRLFEALHLDDKCVGRYLKVDEATCSCGSFNSPMEIISYSSEVLELYV